MNNADKTKVNIQLNSKKTNKQNKIFDIEHHINNFKINVKGLPIEKLFK